VAWEFTRVPAPQVKKEEVGTTGQQRDSALLDVHPRNSSSAAGSNMGGVLACAKKNARETMVAFRRHAQR
jgi:hypothetical protein